LSFVLFLEKVIHLLKQDKLKEIRNQAWYQGSDQEKKVNALTSDQSLPSLSHQAL
jgi:hypothetical protein